MLRSDWHLPMDKVALGRGRRGRRGQGRAQAAGTSRSLSEPARLHQTPNAPVNFPAASQGVVRKEREEGVALLKKHFCI